MKAAMIFIGLALAAVLAGGVTLAQSQERGRAGCMMSMGMMSGRTMMGGAHMSGRQMMGRCPMMAGGANDTMAGMMERCRQMMGAREAQVDSGNESEDCCLSEQGR